MAAASGGEEGDPAVWLRGKGGRGAAPPLCGLLQGRGRLGSTRWEDSELPAGGPGPASGEG